MIEELPDLGDFFNENPKSAPGNEVENKGIDHEILVDEEIYIYISKEPRKWSAVSFIDVAPGNIGLHVLLPIAIEFSASDLDNVRIKFVKKQDETPVTLKEAPILIRWQERDPLSGKIKLGIHFHGEVKTDPIIANILNELKNKKNKHFTD